MVDGDDEVDRGRRIEYAIYIYIYISIDRVDTILRHGTTLRYIAPVI